MVVPWIGLVAAVAAGVSGTQAAAPQPLLFDCDAPAGEVSSMNADHLTPATTISGNLQALETRAGGDLRPAATIRLSSRKDFVAVQMTPIEPNGSTFQVLVRNGDAKEEERFPLGQVTLNQTVPFRITQNGKDVVIAANGQSVSVRQSFRGTPNVGVSCSAGRFRFQNVEME